MEYKIIRVSEKPPKEWGEGASKTYYTDVMVEGHDKPISVGKKQPNALKVGDVLTGTITPTEYESDKFKPTSNFGGGSKKEVDHDSMYRCNALNNAVVKGGDVEEILKNANTFYSWLNKKEDLQNVTNLFSEKSGLEKARETAESLRPAEKPEKKLEVTDEFGEGEIDLESIPF